MNSFIYKQMDIQQPQVNQQGKQQQKRVQACFQKSISLFLEQLLFKNQLTMSKNQQRQQVRRIDLSIKQKRYRFRQCIQILSNMLNGQQNILATLKIAHLVIKRFIYYKINPLIMNSYIFLMGKYKEYQKNVVNLQQLYNLLNQIGIHELGYFCQAFSLAIKYEKAAPIIQQLVKMGDYRSALKLVVPQAEKKSLLQIIAYYAQKQSDKRILDDTIQEIIRMGFKKEDFIRLHQARLRLQMIQIYQNEGYQYAQECFRYNPKMMVLIAEKLIKDPTKKQQLYSFCNRNQFVIQYIKDKGAQQRIIKQIKTRKTLKENFILVDTFKPSDTKKYFSLQNFGIEEKDVIFIKSDTPQLQSYLQDIVNSQLIGLDTQSYVARSKFSTDNQLIATIQISNSKRAYIFDAKDINNPIISDMLEKFFCDQKKIVVGHTLKEDMNATLLALGIKKQCKCKCEDIKYYFKKLYPGYRAGLAAICQTLLSKPICKKFTLTDWGRRPLLKNQMHYAALDAVIVIHLYDILQKQEKGKQSKITN